MTLIDRLLNFRGCASRAVDEPILLPADYVYGHDRNTFKVLAELEERSVAFPEQTPHWDRAIFFQDHYSPPPNEETAILHSQQRFISRTKGVRLFGVGCGVGHQLAIEHVVSAGEIAVGVDSHTCTVGGLGALGLRQPPTAVAQALGCGYFRFDMPRVVRIEMIGSLNGNCSGKDVMLSLATRGPNAFNDKLMEFGGAGLASLNMADRFTLANMTTDMRARGGICEIDDVTLAYHRRVKRNPPLVKLKASPSNYQEVVIVNLDNIQPMVAPPPTIYHAVPVSTLEKSIYLDAIFIGSCTNGRYEDFIEFSEELGDASIAGNTRVIATPASSSVLEKLIHDGTLARLCAANVVINPPGCGPCMGLHQGILSSGEVALATGSRNNAGRMGSKESSIYLSGARTAGASAKSGFLSSPSMKI